MSLALSLCQYVLRPRRGLAQASPSLEAPRLHALETRDLLHQHNRKGKVVIIKTRRYKRLVLGFVFCTWNWYFFWRRSWGLPCCPVTLGGTAVMLGHCAKPGAQLRSWLSTKLGAAACGHWPCCIACCCCCCCCLWHELRFCAACLAPKPGKPEPSLRSGELSDDVLGGNLVLYPCSICVEVGELGSIPLVSLVTPACNPWGIPGPFYCILNLHLTRPRSTQLRYHVKI